jgi:hypothetical protein
LFDRNQTVPSPRPALGQADAHCGDQGWPKAIATRLVLDRSEHDGTLTSGSVALKAKRKRQLLPYGTDQLIDAAMARALHADACRDHALVAWVVL